MAAAVCLREDASILLGKHPVCQTPEPGMGVLDWCGARVQTARADSHLDSHVVRRLPGEQVVQVALAALVAHLAALVPRYLQAAAIQL